MRKLATSILLAVTCVLVAVPVRAADLRVTDSSGAVVELANARIDYTSYSFIYTPDFEYSGIRAYQGDGTVTITWDRIKKVEILKKDTTATPYRLKGKITFKKDDKEVDVDLVIDSKKGLVGETELGEFSIDFEKVKTISVTKVK